MVATLRRQYFSEKDPHAGLRFAPSLQLLRIIKKTFRLRNSNSLYLSRVLDLRGLFYVKERVA